MSSLSRFDWLTRMSAPTDDLLHWADVTGCGGCETGYEMFKRLVRVMWDAAVLAKQLSMGSVGKLAGLRFQFLGIAEGGISSGSSIPQTQSSKSMDFTQSIIPEAALVRRRHCAAKETVWLKRSLPTRAPQQSQKSTPRSPCVGSIWSDWKRPAYRLWALSCPANSD